MTDQGSKTCGFQLASGNAESAALSSIAEWPFSRSRRLNFTTPDGARIGISVPADVNVEELIAEFASIERQVAFGHARAIINFDGPPKGLRQRATWALAVTVSRIAQWAKIGWSYSLGRARAERTVREYTDAFRAALSEGQR